MADSGTTFGDPVKAGYDACLTNATQLLTSAETVWQQTGFKHVAYVLAVFALEEVGKAELLKVQTIETLSGDALASEKASEAHTKKLFWALWSNTLISKTPIQNEIEELRGLAARLHETRLAANYVDPFAAEGNPEAAVDEGFLKNLLSLVRTRIELAVETGYQPASVENKALLNWFIAYYQHPETRERVFAPVSVKMLYQLGDYVAWIKWLKAQADAIVAEGLRLARLEIARPNTGSTEFKWKATIRLHCQSHSIRPKLINEWNKLDAWIKLGAVGKSKEVFDLTFYLPEAAGVGQLWELLLDISNRFVLALNIGCRGFFWWYMPEKISRYYEKIEDIKSNATVKIEATPNLRLGWGNLVLSKNDLGATLEAFNFLSSFREDNEPFMFYRMGCVLLAKNDLLFRVEREAFLQFFSCMRALIRRREKCHDAVCRERYGEFVEKLVSDGDLKYAYFDFGLALEAGRTLEKPITLSEAFAIKLICDAYLFQMMKERRKADESENEASSNAHATNVPAEEVRPPNVEPSKPVEIDE